MTRNILHLRRRGRPGYSIPAADYRHSVSAYQPGVTRPMGEVSDPEGYKAAQQQRYYERQIRASKRLKAAAMDDAAARKAQVRVRAYQQKVRDLVVSKNLKRLPYREQIGKAI